jgi:hypothetical protein
MEDVVIHGQREGGRSKARTVVGRMRERQTRMASSRLFCESLYPLLQAAVSL